MKKQYSKPDIMFESFSLCTNIASGCEHGTNFTYGVCGYEFTDEIYIFTTEVSGCNRKIEDGSSRFDGICYHNPSDLNNIFQS